MYLIDFINGVKSISTHSLSFNSSSEIVAGNSSAEMPMSSNFELPHSMFTTFVSSLSLKTTGLLLNFDTISESFLAGRVILPGVCTDAIVFDTMLISRSVAAKVM